MPRLSEIADRTLAIDLRIGLPAAAAWYNKNRTPNYSLWPNDPFGASIDHNVWPSVFVRPGSNQPDRITLETGEAPFWDAFNMWDDVREMVRYMRPLPVVTNVIAVGIDAGVRSGPTDETALANLIENGVTAETLEMQAVLLGYDVVDGYFESALFMSHLDTFNAGDVCRTNYGLVERKMDAQSLCDRLQSKLHDRSTLHTVSIWALGERPATHIV